MNRTKEESINSTPDKETLIVTPKIAKRPIERPYERKASNTSGVSIQESVQLKAPIADTDEISEPKVFKSKVTNGGNLLKSENLSLLSNEDNKNLRIVKNIGFENLPNQMYRRSLFNGFEFNLMVVGCSGLGKSTFVNSLFLSDLYNADNMPPSKRIQKTVYINTTTVCLKENAVDLKLTLIDTPGFGDSVDNTNCWNPIVDYIELKYNEYMLSQNHLNRSKIQDKRVHTCLYFIEPTGHGMKPLDLEFMSQIHNKVNIVPIIAKADTMVPDECAEFKKTILSQIKTAGIRIYDFSEEAAAISLGATSNKSRETNLKEIITKRQRQPFAIVSSNVIIEKGGNKVRGRTYPWGVVEVDNLEHNDFSALRTLLLSSHLQDLRDHTDHVLYENFRFTRLSSIAESSQFGTIDGKDPMSQMDDERREFELKIKKMEDDMEQLFDQKVQAKTRKLEEFQQQIRRNQIEMEETLKRELIELDNRRNEYEAQRLEWEEMCRDSSLRASMDNLDMKDKSKTKKWLIK